MSALAALGLFSALSLNLVLHLGLSIAEIGAEPDRPIRPSLVQWGILFLSVLCLWLLFSYLVHALSLDFLGIFALFPLSVLLCRGFELVLTRLFPALMAQERPFSPRSAYGGLVPAAFILTRTAALSFTDAAVLALGFSLGGLLSMLLVRAVHRRSLLEAVPQSLRGTPLTLISMGLLSLIFSSLAGILFKKIYFF